MRLRRIIQPMDGDIMYRHDKYAHDPELMEAYECGLKEGRKMGWREAMEEVDGYHERRGNVIHRGGDGSRILYREEPEWDDDGEIVYRRRRDSRGRYI